MSDNELLTRTFNTAIIASKTPAQDFSKDIYAILKSPAFQAILVGIRHLEESQNISEKEACDQIISTFKRLDSIWSEYVYQEGLKQIKGSTASVTTISERSARF